MNYISSYLGGSGNDDDDGDVSQYEIKDKIGSGANGEVYLAENGGQQFAYKNIEADQNTIKDIQNELEIAKELKNVPNVVKFVKGSVDTNDNKVVFVSEMINGIDLERLIYSDITISIEQIKWIVAQLLTGLNGISSKDIIHFDIKPSNAMITFDSYTVKYIDFGTSYKVDKVQKISTTFNYTNRFIYNIIRDDNKVKITEEMKKYDLWCVGCILYELYNRDFLFKSVNKKDHGNKLGEYSQKFMDPSFNFFSNNETGTEEEIKMNQFFRSFMKPDMSQMPTVSEVMEYEWIKDYVEVNRSLYSNSN